MANIGAVMRAVMAAVLLAAVGFGSLATSTSLPSALANPGDLPTDARGFVGTTARCDGPMRIAALGRTTLSLIAVCSDPRGQFEYRGMRIRDRAPLRLPATELAYGCFGVRGDGVDYTVSPNKLLLTAGMRIVRDETMLQYEDRRMPESAPISKTTGSVR